MSRSNPFAHAGTLAAIENLLNGFDGAVMIDRHGNIVIITDKYCMLSGLDKKDVLGTHILKHFPNSRMQEVIMTGKPIHGDLWEINGEKGFVSRIPVIWQGKIVGGLGVSLFRYLREAKDFASRLSSLDLELAYHEAPVRKRTGAKYSFDTIIGDSAAINEAKHHARQVAPLKTPVLLIGETGTGKELFAHAIHQDSDRRTRPFMRVNCAAIPETLAESELFGYADGAFTGARREGKKGKFELAHEGTIFFDEISELPPSIQPKLLRILQEGEFERVGGTEIITADTRLISASSADLHQMVKTQRFREDLYYRLNTHIIQIPPLRRRHSDIPMLCEHFIERCNLELGTEITGLAPAVLNRFLAYSWPGNVRELRNTLDKMCLDTRQGVIGRDRIPQAVRRLPLRPLTVDDVSLAVQMDEAEREILLNALEKANWNRNKAASLLQIHRSSLHAKMKKHHLLDSES